MIKIAYDAGHGIETPGKRSPDNEREWIFNDAVARSFSMELSLYDGVTTKRFDDETGVTDVDLKTRTDGANTWGADYFISFHHNAFKGEWGTHTGVETYTYTNPSVESVELANALHPTVVKTYGLSDRGIKKADFHIVRETKMAAILIEGGFMDSTIDIKKLRDKAVLDNAGKLIAQALAAHIGLKKKRLIEINDYDNHRAKTSIKKAILVGVMTGYPNGNFGPNDVVTRGQLAVILDRLGLLE